MSRTTYMFSLSANNALSHSIASCCTAILNASSNDNFSMAKGILRTDMSFYACRKLTDPLIPHLEMHKICILLPAISEVGCNPLLSAQVAVARHENENVRCGTL